MHVFSLKSFQLCINNEGRVKLQSGSQSIEICKSGLIYVKRCPLYFRRNLHGIDSKKSLVKL